MGLFNFGTKQKPKPKSRKGISPGSVYGWTGTLLGSVEGTEGNLPASPTFADAERVYASNATVRACVDTVANAAASVPLVAYTGKGTLKAESIIRGQGLAAGIKYLKKAQAAGKVQRKEQIDFNEVQELDATHPVVQTLLNPNPQQSREEWIAAFIGFQLLAGDAFIRSTLPVEKGRPRYKSELYFLNPDKIAIEGDGLMGSPKAYIYKPDVGQTVKLTSEQVLHVKASAFASRGVSPLSSCVDAVNQNNAARKWNAQLLKNSGKPSAHANYKGEEGLDDESFDLLLSDLNQFFSPSNNGKVVLTTNTELEEWGLSPDEMSWLSGLQESSREICRAFRVAPQILGDVTTQTYANYREARQSLYMDTVIPVLERLTSALTRWYRAWDPTFLLLPNVDEIEALGENVSDKFTRANACTFLTVDERRMMVGYEPIGGELGGKIMVSSAMAPLDMLAATDVWMNSDVAMANTRGSVGEEEDGEEPPADVDETESNK